MVDQAQYIGFLLLWLACLVFILSRQRQHGAGAGLVIACVLGHWESSSGCCSPAWRSAGSIDAPVNARIAVIGVVWPCGGFRD